MIELELILTLITAMLIAWNTYLQHQKIIPVVQKIEPIVDKLHRLNGNLILEDEMGKLK